MDTTDIIGAAGVGLLLLAYLLLMMKVLNRNDNVYIVMNLLGASIACYASVLLEYMPFIILEAFWALIALAALIGNLSNGWIRR
ncbi:MAG: hypothetical protein K9G67_10900 [Bacteroidales bacterium]|nr:hypothetical protein [Bacteroidales bacterium]MCF8350781.1 hypothetical protein [Bacteroidales bacterium]MCF8376853.1 hypothetical protein [Bacteroidales bacterium]MCF8401868.1 hypothetical protein [Bacteroidales bacterium]